MNSVGSLKELSFISKPCMSPTREPKAETSFCFAQATEDARTSPFSAKASARRAPWSRGAFVSVVVDSGCWSEFSCDDDDDDEEEATSDQGTLIIVRLITSSFVTPLSN